MAQATIDAGATSGEALAVTIRSNGSGVDMTTVTAVVLEVRWENGTCQDWPTTLSGQSQSQLVATHTGGEGTGAGTIPAGSYTARAYLTTPGGVVRSERFTLTVNP